MPLCSSLQLASAGLPVLLLPLLVSLLLPSRLLQQLGKRLRLRRASPRVSEGQRAWRVSLMVRFSVLLLLCLSL